MQRYRLPILLFGVLSCAGLAGGQVAPGAPNFSAFDAHEIDTVNLMNNNILLRVPVRSKGGSLPFSYMLTANSYAANGGAGTLWGSSMLGDTTQTGAPFFPSVNNILSENAEASSGAGYLYTTNHFACGTVLTTKYSGFYVRGPSGTLHMMPSNMYTTASSASGCQPSATGTATDDSGLTLSVTGNATTTATIYTASGDTISSTISMSDSNGNAISNSTGSAWTDSMGMNVASQTGIYSAPVYTWTDVNGASQHLSQTISTNLSFQTNYGCTGINEGGTLDLPLTTGFSFPDGTSLAFSYEITPGHSPHVTGRINQITLRELGTVAYTYGGGSNGIDCTYQTVPILTRTLGNGDVTTYTLTHPQIGSSANYQAVNTVLDPGNNKTIYTFTGFTSTGVSSGFAQVVTEVQRYQGSGTLLTTDLYSYNTAFTSTPSATTISQAQVIFPVSKVIIYHQISGMGNWSATETHFDTYGNSTYVAEYDFGGTSPARQTVVTYYQAGTSCGALSSGSQINNKPCEEQISQNGSTVADVKYTYDTHGNLLTTSVWTGSSWIGQTSSNAYNANGTPAKTFDLANNETDYAYASGNYSDGCSGATQYPFPTSVTNVGTGLTTSFKYDCTGGVVLSKSDPNGNAMSYGYSNGAADPYWRVLTTTDPYSSVVFNNYPTGSSPDVSSVSFEFNSSNSVNNPITTTDPYGRRTSLQVAQQPSGNYYDTVTSSYTWNATGYTNYLQVTSSQLCSATSGGTCTTVHYSYFDPLGRLHLANTASNETITHAYIQNDDLVTLTPNGGLALSTQTEYDGLGRVAKVCHIGTTPSTGSGTACGQHSGSANGETDSYSYTQGTGWTKVSITRGSQTRSKTFDAMGRVTQIVTPEGGTWNYYYDIQGGCPGSVPGELTIVQDPNSGTNGTCYYYDSLGRVVTESARTTICRHFYYDNTTGYKGTIPTGITLSNQYGRLVEAATDACASNTLKTDEWFAYDKNGRTTDFWEQEYSTPTQYYHSKATFFENGAVKTLQIVNPSAYTLTYTLDGEGRWNSMTDTTAAQNIVTSVNAFPLSNPEVVNLTGTTPDNDAYTIDANTNRISQYVFTVGNTPKTLTGVLTWNPNGTLAKLVTTDGFDSGGSLTCTDAYDDWARLTSFDCGSGNWGQSFSYDVYDNLSKSVLSGRTGTSWNPGYSSSTNQFIGGSFDSNGNATADGTGSNYWGWNEFSKMAWYNTSSIPPTCGTSGKCMIYDAFGRVISYTNGSYWYDLFYTQNGGQVTMTSPNIYYAKFPAPGHHGVAVIYGNNSTYVNYLHGDWLGNARINSTVVSNTEGDDRAYTPYGEQFTTYGLTESWYQDFAGMTGDFNNGIQWETPNREFAVFGRWLSPDPSGQGGQWNRYAYTTNPNSFTDPSGLGVRDCNWTSGCLTPCNAYCAWSNGGAGGGGGLPPINVGSGGIYFVGPLWDIEGQWEAAYSPFVLQFVGSLYGKKYAPITFATWDDYADWRTAIAALPASQIYAAFSVICQNQGCDPNEQVAVKYQYGALVYSVVMDCKAGEGCVVSKDSLDGYYGDPITSFHQGNASWYSGLFFDTPHLIGSDPLGAHIDPFGPFNPLHYLIQLPSMLFGYSSWKGATCSLNGGCSP